MNGAGKRLGDWSKTVRVTAPPARNRNRRSTAPAYADASVALSVAENTAAGSDIGNPVAAADPDAGDTLTYSLSGADKDHFAIDAATGQLQTHGALDYEGQSSYSVTVTATDGGGLADSIPVTITVTDVADNPPGQPAAPEIINVQQTSFRVTWTAPADGSSAIAGYGIQYKLVSASDSAYADVKPTPTGTGTGYNLVNRSGQTVAERTFYAVRVRASNTGGWGPWSAAAVAFTTTPANQAPAFANSSVTLTVAENTAAGADIGNPVAAADPDAGDTLTYSLSGADKDHFAIDAASGQLQTKGALDYEGQSSYSVTVTATDGGGLADSIPVTITVTDVADNPPGQPAAPEIINVQQTSFRVTWTAPADGSSAIAGYGIQYKLVSASDSAYADVKPTPTGTGTGYNLVNRSGQTVAERTFYAVRVRASNTGGWGPWSAPAVAVTTSGAPANQAPAFANSSVTLTVAENTAAGADIGTPVTAADPDAGDTVTYRLGGDDADHFAIDSASGQLQTKGDLDYESTTSYSVTVTATDGDGLSASIAVTISVTDVDERPADLRPDNLRAELQPGGAVLVSWDAPDGAGADAFYRVARRPDADGHYRFIARRVIDADGGGRVEYRDDGGELAAGQTYRYRARVFNGDGKKLGNWSKAVKVTVPPAADASAEGKSS